MTAETQITTTEPVELTEAPNGQYYCEQCSRRYLDGAVECPHCDDEPLLDLHDPAVRDLLKSFDERDWQRRAAKFTVISCVVCLPVLILVIVEIQVGIAGYILSVLGLSSLLIKWFPGRKRLPESS